MNKIIHETRNAGGKMEARATGITVQDASVWQYKYKRKGEKEVIEKIVVSHTRSGMPKVITSLIDDADFRILSVNLLMTNKTVSVGR